MRDEAQDDLVSFLMAAAKAAIMHYTAQENPQENPPGVETFVMNGEAGVLLPNAKELRCGAAGIHMLVQKFMPSVKAAHGFMAKGLKPCIKNGENDIGSCVGLARKAPKGDGRAPVGSPKPENAELMNVTVSRATRSNASAAVS
jgi:hypothetical protein